MARAPARLVVDAFAALVAKAKALDARAIREPERLARLEVGKRLEAVALPSGNAAVQHGVELQAHSAVAQLGARLVRKGEPGRPGAQPGTRKQSRQQLEHGAPAGRGRVRSAHGPRMRGLRETSVSFHLAQTGTGLHLGFIWRKHGGSVARRVRLAKTRTGPQLGFV